jgi:hypothetical protein
MEMSDNDLAGVEPRLAAAYGRAAWGTALGVGRFLTVEFGAQRAEPDPGRRVHGEFHLWVYCSAWRIDTPRDIVTASEDPREHLETAVPYLDGRTLSAIRIQPPSL